MGVPGCQGVQLGLRAQRAVVSPWPLQWRWAGDHQRSGLLRQTHQKPAKRGKTGRSGAAPDSDLLPHNDASRRLRRAGHVTTSCASCVLRCNILEQLAFWACDVAVAQHSF